MLTLPGSHPVYLAAGSTDLRKSIDGLAALVQEGMGLDPFSPSLFVFCNRERNKLKLLFWDTNGFWLYYRRLERGSFQWPTGREPVLRITSRELCWLLDGLSLRTAMLEQQNAEFGQAQMVRRAVPFGEAETLWRI